MISRLNLLLLFFLPFVSCNDDTDQDNLINTDITKEVTINLLATYQTIEGFSASDCWTSNYVGKHWNEDQKEAIAKLLFSQSLNNGRPQGIGLSMWRFNLGGGTAGQGDESDIADKSRRAECFIDADGTFNPGQHSGQQYFIDQASKMGCGNFVMFSNTPPVYFTYNGKGYSQKGEYSNLKPEHYEDFADFIARSLLFFKEKGIDFSYVSPVNEPQYNWDSPSQEGSGWQNSEISQITRLLDSKLSGNGLDTKILLTEAGDWEYLYKSKNGAARSNQIETLFNPESELYVGNLNNVANVAGAHSYWTDSDWSGSRSVREAVNSAAQSRGLKVFQTEWSMLSENYEGYPGHDKATDMDMALVMARVIHQDMLFANASSWSYWTSMDLDRWGHKSRFLLIRLTPEDGVYGDIEKSGTHEASKTLWTLGNYSLFVRPGYKRVDLNISNQSNSFFATSYISPDEDKLVCVFTNLTSKAISVVPSLKGNKKLNGGNQYTTSSVSDMENMSMRSNQCVISGNSVVTAVYDLK